MSLKYKSINKIFVKKKKDVIQNFYSMNEESSPRKKKNHNKKVLITETNESGTIIETNFINLPKNIPSDSEKPKLINVSSEIKPPSEPSIKNKSPNSSRRHKKKKTKTEEEETLNSIPKSNSESLEEKIIEKDLNEIEIKKEEENNLINISNNNEFIPKLPINLNNETFSGIPKPKIKRKLKNSQNLLFNSLIGLESTGPKIIFSKDIEGNSLRIYTPKIISNENNIENPLFNELNERFEKLSYKSLIYFPKSKDNKEAISKLAFRGVLISKLNLLNSQYESLKLINQQIKQNESNSSAFTDLRREMERLQIDLKIARDYKKNLQTMIERGQKNKFSLVTDNQLEETLRKHGISLSKSRTEKENLIQEVELLNQKIDSFNKRIGLMLNKRQPLYTL